MNNHENLSMHIDAEDMEFENKVYSLSNILTNNNEL